MSGAFPAKARAIAVDRPDLSRALVALGFPIPGPESPDKAASDLLVQALAGGLDSRIGRIRGRTGWIYAFDEQIVSGRGRSLLVVWIEVAANRVGELLAMIADEVRSLAREGIAADELERLRNGRARALAVVNAMPEVLAATIRERWSSGLDLEGVRRQTEAIEGVTAVAIRRVATTSFAPGADQVVVVGPLARIQPQLSRLRPLMLRYDPARGLITAGASR
jgi:zinc protease